MTTNTLKLWDGLGEEEAMEMEALSEELTIHYLNTSFLHGENSTANNTHNITIENTYFPYYQHSLPVAVSFILAYLFIFLLCMVGNGLVCLILLENRCMRTVTNLFILNLAISDLLVGIFCIPTTLVDNLITGWPFTNTVCKFSGLVQGMSVSSSVFTLVAIAGDRFRCIVYPFQPKLTLLVAKVTIMMIWVLALVIMCPSAAMLTMERVENHYMVNNQDYSHTYPLYSCFENWADPQMRKVYTTVLFAHIYLAPLTLITLMYGRIGVKLYTTAVISGREPAQEGAHVQSAPPAPAAQQEGRSHISHKKIRVIKMLGVVALLFMLSWLPLWTLMLLTDYGDLDGEWLELLTGYAFPFAHWLAFSNSSVNPIIYGYYNENFKRGFQAVCQPYSCCSPLGRCKSAGRKEREGRAGGRTRKAGGLRDTATTANPLKFRVRNRVHMDDDLQDSVCLELKLKKNSGGGSSAEGGGSGTGNKKGLQMEDMDGINPMGAGVSLACDP